jgi:hypothetical protein
LPLAGLTATGTPSSSTYLRGDNTWATIAGSGTVTVVGSGSLTSTAFVTGGGSATLQTPNASATLDSSGNAVFNSVSTGTGSGIAGYFQMKQGTATAVGTTNITLMAPTSVTSWSRTFAGSVGVTGYLKETVSGTNQTESTVATIPATDISSGALNIGTGNAATVGTIELGAASDTTVSRSAAGVIAVEGVNIPSISSTDTLTNKRITTRITTITSSATPGTSINTDNCDLVTITAQAAAITSMTTGLSGTPVNGDQLEIRIKDDGTARAITWGASYASGIATLQTTTIAGKALCNYFEYDSVQTKWMLQAVGSYP